MTYGVYVNARRESLLVQSDIKCIQCDGVSRFAYISIASVVAATEMKNFDPVVAKMLRCCVSLTAQAKAAHRSDQIQRNLFFWLRGRSGGLSRQEDFRDAQWLSQL